MVRKNKILLLGKGSYDYNARDIVSIDDKNQAYSLFGPSEIYDAYELLATYNITNVDMCNCYNESDYIRVIDEVVHYDYYYIIPVSIYIDDSFYNSIENKQEYYFIHFLKQLSEVDSLSTILMTARHASLYKDFDHYILSMHELEDKIFNDETSLLKTLGNNINFVYNNIKDVAFANVLLGALYLNRPYQEYFQELHLEAIYHIDKIDMIGYKAMYFKNRTLTNNVSLENAINFKNSKQIYDNAIVDDVIKNTIREVDLDKYKGKLYNPYIAKQLYNTLQISLNHLKNKLFKSYSINDIYYKKLDASSGVIIVDYNIVPYGSLEDINIIMGV